MEFEFAAGVVGCTLIGWWVDRTFGTGNKGIVTGAIVGCVGGMYHLIRRAFALQRRSGGDQERSADRKDDFDTPRGE
jgi:F0F1-type ATP synthase assembly protein I